MQPFLYYSIVLTVDISSTGLFSARVTKHGGLIQLCLHSLPLAGIGHLSPSDVQYLPWISKLNPLKPEFEIIRKCRIGPTCVGTTATMERAPCSCRRPLYRTCCARTVRTVCCSATPDQLRGKDSFPAAYSSRRRRLWGTEAQCVPVGDMWIMREGFDDS